MARMTRIGWGILGCGWIATDAVAPAIVWSKNGRLVAVASREARTAEAKARQTGAQRAYSPYEAMLDDAEVHAIYIGLPNGLHEEWAIRCAEAGKHVLCEKSLTFTADSARRMRAAFRARGLRLVEAFMYRHHPQWALVRDLLERGEIGRIHAIRGSFCSRFDNLSDHRWSSALGGGALWDLTCYSVDAARYLTHAEPIRAVGVADARTPQGVDATTQASLELEGGVMASATGSLRAGFDQSLIVLGDEGVLEVARPFAPGWDPASVTVRRRDGQRHFDVPGANQFLHQMEHFAALVIEPGRPAWPSEDGVGNVTACEAIERSWRSPPPPQPTGTQPIKSSASRH
jgi:predicted dehydrogenase